MEENKNKDIKENIKVEAIDGKYCQWRSMKFEKVKHTHTVVKFS